jgi:L-lactate utilization protein LutC
MQDSFDVESAAAAKAALLTAAQEVSSLLSQVHAAGAENEQLRKDLEASRLRESSQQALLDAQQPGDQLVAFNLHMQVVHENRGMKDQIEQLKRDLEVMYMDNNFITGAAGGISEMGGIGPSQMNTASRLASLLAPSEMSHFNLAVRLPTFVHPSACHSSMPACSHYPLSKQLA